jgi:AraC-like DNA-binding protein
VFRLYRKYIGWLPSLQSNDDSLNPVWLRHFIVLMTIAAVIWAADIVLGMMFDRSYADSFGFSFAVLLFALFLAVESLSRAQTAFPKILRDSIRTEENTEADKRDAPKDWSNEGNRIENAVKEHQWYLEPGLSLSQLSRRVGMNRAYLSRAINDGLKTNFSDFINTMRVDYAKSLIDDGELKMLDIALAAGFGSKASFNRVFRRLSGKTPSQYRDNFVS